MTGRLRIKERIVWIAIVAVVVVISAFMITKYQTALNRVSQKITAYETEKAIWLDKEKDLTLKLADLIAKTENSSLESIQASNNPDIIIGLKRQGFEGSVEDIKTDLTKHSELIPYEGVLGGKMGFYYKENIFVLSDKWVLAGFDDGHINGYMLLSYKIDNGAIAWEVIDSYLFGQ